MTRGRLREAMVRALVHVSMARGAVDERDFEAIRRLARVTRRRIG